MEPTSSASCPRPRARRAVFMAFGTKGDVFPIAAIAAALACDQPPYQVFLITHSAHKSLHVHLEKRNVCYVPISTLPVVPFCSDGDKSESKFMSFVMQKKNIQARHREECLSAFEKIFGDGRTSEADLVVINFFALEGWSLAELFQVQCIVAAPYVVPYSAPSSFERKFRQELPFLYKYLQEAPPNKVYYNISFDAHLPHLYRMPSVCWKDVIHWLWPLYTEDWASWRTDHLYLSPLPFLDPVTDLPIWHMRADSPLLLYGVSKEIVECPGYWPDTAHACGFWFLPMECQFSCSKCTELYSSVSAKGICKKIELCEEHSTLERFLMEKSTSSPPIFVGLSSIGSMGFLRNPRAFLLVLRSFLDITNHSIILFSAGYKQLDDAINSIVAGLSNSNKQEAITLSKDSTVLFSNRLFCFSGAVPFSWLFPRCAAAVHHGGSGSTAAALHAGIPQITCPFLLDQFYWAERLCWLGLAPEPLKRKYLVPDNEEASNIEQGAKALSEAVNLALSPEIKAQASKFAEKLSREDGVGEALKVLKEKIIFPRAGTR